MKKIEKRSPQIRPGSKIAYRLSSTFMTAILLLVLSTARTMAQGYVEGVNISYEHMPMKVETPAGDQKFTGNNLKIATSIPIFLTLNKSKYQYSGRKTGLELILIIRH